MCAPDVGPVPCAQSVRAGTRPRWGEGAFHRDTAMRCGDRVSVVGVWASLISLRTLGAVPAPKNVEPRGVWACSQPRPDREETIGGGDTMTPQVGISRELVEAAFLAIRMVLTLVLLTVLAVCVRRAIVTFAGEGYRQLGRRKWQLAGVTQ